MTITIFINIIVIITEWQRPEHGLKLPLTLHDELQGGAEVFHLGHGGIEHECRAGVVGRVHH